MSDETLTPEQFADELDLTLEGRRMLKGVEFAEYTDDDGDSLFTLIYPDGNVDTQTLSAVYADGNLTMGRTRKGDLEVMLDDDGVHRDW